MSDTPGPWRRLGREHFQRCGGHGTRVYRYMQGVYRWQVYGPPRRGTDPFLEAGAAPTLAAAKRAATAALIRHAPMPF